VNELLFTAFTFTFCYNSHLALWKINDEMLHCIFYHGSNGDGIVLWGWDGINFTGMGIATC